MLHRSHHSCEYYSDIPYYLGGAKGIATLGTYHDPTTVGTPRVTLYPPLQSAFLAPWLASSDAIEKQLDHAGIAMQILHGLAVLAAFAVLRWNSVDPLVSALSACLVATSPQWLALVGKFMSDPLFSLLCFIGAFALFRLPPKPDWKLGIVLGVLGSLLFLCRTAALPISFTIGLWSLSHLRKTRNPCWLIPGLTLSATLALWFLYTRGGYHYGRYFSETLAAEKGALNPALRTLRQGFQFISLDEFAEAYMTAGYNWISTRPFPIPWVASLAGLALTGLCVIGFRARNLPVDRWSLLALGLYAFQISVWPFPLRARCALPLLPWIGVWGWAGLAKACSGLGGRKIAVPLAASVLFVGIFTNAYVSVSFARLWTRESAVSDLVAVADWAKDHVPGSEPIGTRTSVPRVQLSAMISRPLVLIWGPTTPLTDPASGSFSGGGAASAWWLIRSSADQQALPPSTLVFSRGKWRVHRIPAPSPSPAAPAP